MSNLTDHAEYELRRAGMYDDDADYGGGVIANCVMDLIKVFSDQEHSGFSSGYVLSLFDKLARFEPLLPITSDPEEWTEVVGGNKPMWQNKRRSSSFSHDGGQTWYDINDASLNNGATWYSQEDTDKYLSDLGYENSDGVVLDSKVKSMLWDEAYELQRDWRKEQGLPDDGSVMFDAELNKRLRKERASQPQTSGS